MHQAYKRSSQTQGESGYQRPWMNNVSRSLHLFPDTRGGQRWGRKLRTCTDSQGCSNLLPESLYLPSTPPDKGGERGRDARTTLPTQFPDAPEYFTFHHTNRGFTLSSSMSLLHRPEKRGFCHSERSEESHDINTFETHRSTQGDKKRVCATGSHGTQICLCISSIASRIMAKYRGRCA